MCAKNVHKHKYTNNETNKQIKTTATTTRRSCSDIDYMRRIAFFDALITHVLTSIISSSLGIVFSEKQKIDKYLNMNTRDRCSILNTQLPTPPPPKKKYSN